MASPLAPSFRPGELDQRVELQKEVRTPDNMGGFTSSWVVQDEVWAHVRPLTGNEREQADRAQAEGGYKVIIRYRSDVTEAWRIRWVDEDRLMNIRFGEDGGKRAMYLPMNCEAGVST